MTSRNTSMLPIGYELQQDQDGDWVLVPPQHVKIVSVPGEGLLIGTCDRETALADAMEYLAAAQIYPEAALEGGEA